MQRGWKRAAALVMAGMLWLVPASASLAEGTWARVDGTSGTGSVNLRQAPSLEAAKLGRYEWGTWVNILSRDDSTGWSYVQCPDGAQGYMSTQFLETTQRMRSVLWASSPTRRAPPI